MTKYIIALAALLLVAGCSDSGDDTAKVVRSTHQEETQPAEPQKDPYVVHDTTPGEQQQMQQPEEPAKPTGPTYTDVTVYMVTFTLGGKRMVVSCDNITADDTDDNAPSNKCGLNLSNCTGGMKYYCVTNAEVIEKTEHRKDKEEDNQ